MKKVEYTVFRRFEMFQICPYCDGEGQKSHTFRNRIFINKCGKCGGSGNMTHIISEEVPFKEAYEDMKKELEKQD